MYGATRTRHRGFLRGVTAFVGAAAVVLAAPALGAPGGEEEEGFGNNLAMPILWSEASDSGARPALRGDGPQTADLTLDPTAFQDVDGVDVFLQQTANTWQAENTDAGDSGLPMTDAGKLPVTFVDWGDNLEVRNPQKPHMLRVETRLLQDVSALVDSEPADDTDATGMTAYSMVKTNDITGVGEMWGAASDATHEAVALQTDEAFVYTSQACLTIERIDNADTVAWNPATRSWTDSVSVAKCMGDTVDGPGGYGAEVTISGGITYGYVWRVPDYPAGLYRLTFSLKPESGADFTEATSVYVSEEAEAEEPVAPAAATEPEDDGDADSGAPIGNPPVVDAERDLSYIDVGISYTSGKPTRPVNLAATRDVEATTLTWDAPVDEGTSPIAEYLVTGSGAGKAVADKRIPADQPLTATFDQLVGGEDYVFSIAAANESGTGDAATISVVPRTAPLQTQPPATTPPPSNGPTIPPSAAPPADKPVVQERTRAQRKVTLRLRAKALRSGKAIRIRTKGAIRTKQKSRWLADAAIVKVYFNPAGPAKARLMKKVRATAAKGYTARFTVRKSGSVFAKVARDAGHKADKSRVVTIRLAR